MADVKTDSKGSRLARFLAGVKGEMKKVAWPSRKQLVAYTGVVIVAVAIVAVFLWVFDAALTEILRILIHR
ncbi:MAG: preprotein translocase subunit SecE [Negativicutes bacterium]|nr:preprotein translocase subunit SecE [Negativicutes bacterium]